MFIMTDRGWQRINCQPSTPQEGSAALRLGYHANNYEARLRELIAMVIPERYER